MRSGGFSITVLCKEQRYKAIRNKSCDANWCLAQGFGGWEVMLEDL